MLRRAPSGQVRELPFGHDEALQQKLHELRGLLEAHDTSEFGQLQLASCLHACAWRRTTALQDANGAIDALLPLIGASNLSVRAEALRTTWNLTSSDDGAADFVLVGGLPLLAATLVAADEMARLALTNAQQHSRSSSSSSGDATMSPGQALSTAYALLEAAIATARNLAVDAVVAQQLAKMSGIVPAMARLVDGDRCTSTPGSSKALLAAVSVGRVAAIRRDAAMVLWQLSCDPIQGPRQLQAVELQKQLPALLRLVTSSATELGDDADAQEAADNRYAWKRSARLTGGGVQNLVLTALSDGDHPMPSVKPVATTAADGNAPAAAAPAAPMSTPSPDVEVSDVLRVAYDEAFDAAVAARDEVEAQHALVGVACNLACDEACAEALLDAGLVHALMPWLPPNVDATKVDVLVPVKCIELAVMRRRRLAAKMALAGAVPPVLAVLRSEASVPERGRPRQHAPSLLPAARALWHMAHTHRGLNVLVREGGLSTLITLQQRMLKQALRAQLLELTCAVLDNACTTMRSEAAVQFAAESKAWLAGASAAHAQLDEASDAVHSASSPGSLTMLDDKSAESQEAAMDAGKIGNAMPAPAERLTARVFGSSLRDLHTMLCPLLAPSTSNEQTMAGRSLRLLRIALTHLASGALPPDTPHPWHEAAGPPPALLSFLNGPHGEMHADACACIGLLAMSERQIPPLVEVGAVEAVLARIPPLGGSAVVGGTDLSPLTASCGLAPKRSLPPWRAAEETALERREELRLQALSALRQLIICAPPGSASDVANRAVTAGAARTLVTQIVGHEGTQASLLARGEAALALDTLCERSRACEMEVFRMGATASLTDAVTAVLQSTHAGARGIDPRREALTPWAIEKNEPFETW